MARVLLFRGNEESVYNCEKGNPAELLFSRQNGKVCFRICADFANNLKHFKLNNSGKIDKDTKITSQGVTISAGLLTPEGVDNNFPYMTRYEWKITADGEEYDVFTLAQGCINEWEKFLKNIENPTP